MKQIKYFQLRILTTMNFTDVRLLELREKKPNSKEYTTFIQQIEISNENSKKVLEFIANYDIGFFLPEKCDVYEPEKEKFDPYKLAHPIRWLSQPGGAVYLKKIKPFKFEGVIENHCLAMVWDEKGIPLSIHKENYSKREPYYLGEIKLFIDEKIIKLKSADYFFDFFNELSDIVNGEYGIIKNPEGHIIIEKGELNIPV